MLKVGQAGQIRVGKRHFFISTGLYGEKVALRPTSDDGVYVVVFIHKVIKKIDLTLGSK